jgi:CO/xanthine dehydrogenase FAD-binding subunit
MPSGLDGAELTRPKTVNAVCAALTLATAKKRKVVLLAGGTDVMLEWHRRAADGPAPLMVDVTGIQGFHTIETRAIAGDERLVVAGGVTYWDLRKSALIARTLPMLADMAKGVGSRQIQTRGTLAGNVASASPAADGVAALMALDANVHLESTDGTRQVPLESFFNGYKKTVMRPEEIIVAMDLRVPLTTASVLWGKEGEPKIALASVIEVESSVFRHVRFGMTSVADATHTLSAVRAYLEGRAIDGITVSELDQTIKQDLKGEQHVHTAHNLIKRALEDATHGAFRAPKKVEQSP